MSMPCYADSLDRLPDEAPKVSALCCGSSLFAHAAAFERARMHSDARYNNKLAVVRNLDCVHSMSQTSVL